MTESDFQTFEAVGALVVVLDADGRIVHWNHCCSDLTGYSLDEVRGRRLWDFALLPEEIEAVRAVFASAATSDACQVDLANYWVTKTGGATMDRLFAHHDHPSRWKHPVHHQDGNRPERAQAGRAGAARLRSQAERAWPRPRRLYEDARHATDDLREANQHMVSATIRAQELTEKVEAALTRSEESERELRAAAEFREMFIGDRGPRPAQPARDDRACQPTCCFSAAASTSTTEKPSRASSAAAERMKRMIIQLLDFTRARLGGGFPIDRARRSARHLRGVVQEFGAPIHLELEGDLTGTWDPDRLAEALSNITGNAIEHAAPGTPVVVRAHAEGAEVVVEVSNRGNAIPDDLLPVIFEPFRRGKREKPATGNLGLGLYIAKQIVLAGGGTLDAALDRRHDDLRDATAPPCRRPRRRPHRRPRSRAQPAQMDLATGGGAGEHRTWFPPRSSSEPRQCHRAQL